MSQVSNDFMSKIEQFNKMADETKELVKKSFGLKSNATATNNTSSFLSVKVPTVPTELKLDEPVTLPQELKLDSLAKDKKE